MSPCNRPKAKQRRIAATGRVTAQRGDPSSQQNNPSSSAPLGRLSDASGDPKIVVDELDGAPQAPADVDEAKELHDADVVHKAVLAAMDVMRLNYSVTMSDEDAREARELFPKMSGFVNHLHKSPTDYASFADIRMHCRDSVHSNVEVPSAVNATRWDSEFRCSDTYRALRTPIEVMMADTKHRNVWKYRITGGTGQNTLHQALAH
ncbi:hypothetical protein FRC07_012501 [Ceratobasidium sp. 392]|nr:hypothetical protein FRC07_012501 [Ceratobasidium sp. 392]